MNHALTFLLELFNDGLGYSAINTARSALSTFITIDSQPVGQAPLVKRFMKSVFNSRPALPRYQVTWDVDMVLRYFKQLGPNKNLSLSLLTQKLAMLALLLSGQRTQTIHLFMFATCI